MTKRMWIFMGACAVLVACCALGTVYFESVREDAGGKAVLLQKEYLKLREEYDNTYTGYRQQLMDEVADERSEDALSDFNLSYTKMSTKGSSVFRAMLTWDNGEMYGQRRVLVKDFVTPDVLDGGFFSEGLDADGNYQVDVIGLFSKFISSRLFLSPSSLNSSLLEGSFVVESESWFDGQNRRTIRDVYAATYDLNTNQFTNLQKEGRLLADDSEYVYNTDR